MLGNNNVSILDDRIDLCSQSILRVPCDRSDCSNNEISSYNRSVSVRVELICSACGTLQPFDKTKTWRDYYQKRGNCPSPACSTEPNKRFNIALFCAFCLKPLCKQRPIFTLANHATIEEYWRSIFSCYWNDTRLPMFFSDFQTNPLFGRIPDDAKILMYYLSNTFVPNDEFFFGDIKNDQVYPCPNPNAMWLAFDESLTTPGKFLYNKLKQKIDSYTHTHNGNPRNVYLRIGINVSPFASAGILEIWPAGHESLKHIHAGCAGAIKVVRGQLHVQISSDLLLPQPIVHKVLEENQITWLSRNHYCVHQVGASELWCNQKGIAFCASFHLYKNCQDEFFAFSTSSITAQKISKSVPKNDIEPEEWNEKKRLIWREHLGL